MEVEFFNRLNQPQIALLNQVKKEHPTPNVSFCNADNQTQVGLCQLLLGSFALRAARLHLLRQFDFFFCRQKGHLTDFLEVHSDGVINIDALRESQVKLLLNLLLRFDIPQNINILTFQIFIDSVNAVGVQIQIRQMIHDLLIFQYILFLFGQLHQFLQLGQ